MIIDVLPTLFLFLLFFWCHCMAINVVSVQYNRELLLDIILLTQCYTIIGENQPGEVANSARGQLNRENEHFPVPVRA